MTGSCAHSLVGSCLQHRGPWSGGHGLDPGADQGLLLCCRVSALLLANDAEEWDCHCHSSLFLSMTSNPVGETFQTCFCYMLVHPTALLLKDKRNNVPFWDANYTRTPL